MPGTGKKLAFALLPLLAFAPVCAAQAQSDAYGVGQIGAADAPSTETSQISTGSRTIEVDLPQRGRRETGPPQQLSGTGESRGSAPQLTGEEESGRSPTQLYRGGPTAQPATPLSTPDEGRTSAVARVEGRDRCDPDAGERQADCAQVIENRAFEFARPTPTKLSPEQRLLVEQPRDDMGNSQAAARRLATNAADPNSMEDQSIASIVLSEGQRAQQRPVEERVEDVAPAGVIEAIVGAITGTPPQR